MVQNLIKDLTTITMSDKKIFEKLIQNSIFCICDYLETASLNNEDMCQIDIGIGTLIINLLDDKITYNFIPNKTFETKIVSTLEDQQNPLVAVIDSTLVSKLGKLYDNFLQ